MPTSKKWCNWITVSQENWKQRDRIIVDFQLTYLSKINLLHTYYVQSTMLWGGMWNCTVLITCYSSLLHRRVLSLSGSCQNEQLTYKWLLWKVISRKSGGRLEQVKQGRRESQSKNVLLSWSLLWVTGLHPAGDPLRSQVERISESFALHTAGGHSTS